MTLDIDGLDKPQNDKLEKQPLAKEPGRKIKKFFRRKKSGDEKKSLDDPKVEHVQEGIEEESLGPGRKRKIFKKNRPAKASEHKKPDFSEKDTTVSKKRRSRNKNIPKKAHKGQLPGKQRPLNKERAEAIQGADLKNAGEYSKNDSAFDGVFAKDVSYDRENFNSRRVRDKEEEYNSSEESFFSSQNGKDFSSMQESEIEYLKPHVAPQDEIYHDMPEIHLPQNNEGNLMDVVGVKTHRSGNVEYYDCKDTIFEKGEDVIVETTRGLSLGEVVVSTTRRYVSKEEIPRVFRKATINDMRQCERNVARAAEAFALCKKLIRELKIDMKLIEVSFLHGGNKAVFYFMSDGRVDFRELVKKLAGQLHIRIEMRQIGVRDVSRMVGGIGICGQSLCCNRFIRDFLPVSIRMAKDQDLVLNPEKVSGQCGRLMCCLAYEQEVYCEQGKNMPRVGKSVLTDDGPGRVRDRDILRKLVRIQLEGQNNLKTFTIEELKSFEEHKEEEEDFSDLEDTPDTDNTDKIK